MILKKCVIPKQSWVFPPSTVINSPMSWAEKTFVWFSTRRIFFTSRDQQEIERQPPLVSSLIWVVEKIFYIFSGSSWTWFLFSAPLTPIINTRSSHSPHLPLLLCQGEDGTVHHDHQLLVSGCPGVREGGHIPAGKTETRRSSWSGDILCLALHWSLQEGRPQDCHFRRSSPRGEAQHISVSHPTALYSGSVQRLGDGDCGRCYLLPCVQPHHGNHQVSFLPLTITFQATNNVEDFGHSTHLLGATTLRNVLGTKCLAEILSERWEVVQVTINIELSLLERR